MTARADDQRVEVFWRVVQGLDIRARDRPRKYVPVGNDDDTVTVTNTGPDTVYYGDSAVTESTGTALSAGSSVDLDASQYFTVAQPSASAFPGTQAILRVTDTPSSGSVGSGSSAKIVHSVSGTPPSGTGSDGDWAIDSSTRRVYGPKAAGAWPTRFLTLSDDAVIFRGVWQPATAYTKGEYVEDPDGYLRRVQSDHTSGATWPTWANMAARNDTTGTTFTANPPRLALAGMALGVYRGAWATSRWYPQGHIIIDPTNGARLLRAAGGHTSDATAFANDTAKWDVVTRRLDVPFRADMLLAPTDTPEAFGDATASPFWMPRSRVKRRQGTPIALFRTTADFDSISGTGGAGVAYGASDDPDNPEGSVLINPNGLNAGNAVTATKQLKDVLTGVAGARNLLNKVLHLRLKLGVNTAGTSDDRTSLGTIELRFSSDGSWTNYHSWLIQNGNEMKHPVDSWTTAALYVADSEMTVVGTGANLAAVTHIQAYYQRSSSSTRVPLHLGSLVVHEPASTRAKVVLSFDDGFSAHWTEVAKRLIKYGFPAVIAYNLQPVNWGSLGAADSNGPKLMRKLVNQYGWQAVIHGWWSNEHNYNTRDVLAGTILKNKHMLHAFGLGGSDDLAWWGGLTADNETMQIVRKYTRSGRTFINNARQIEPFPIGDPHRMWCWGSTGGNSAGIIAYLERVKNAKGIGQVTWHDTPAASSALTELDAVLAWLDTNRADIDVVTIADALEGHVQLV